MRVVNVAVTLGSRLDRRCGRKAELQDACNYLGFELVLAAENGLNGINASSREKDVQNWRQSVSRVAELINAYEPIAVFVPHRGDWNSTHIGTHLLVMDALDKTGAGPSLFVVETEFWGQMPAPNILVESTPDEVAALVTATSLHTGEVARNPYHLSLPFWMQDNVRRGGEVVGGQGGDVPDFVFGTLYRVLRWQDAIVQAFPLAESIMSTAAQAAAVFES
jgi:LmbE family N-acetylglucosaminyl deacetylase